MPQTPDLKADSPSQSVRPDRRRNPTAVQANLFTALPRGSKERAKLKERLQPRIAHGGELRRGKRKIERPFSSSAPLHVVLKSSRARGEWSMLHRRHRSKINCMIHAYAKRFHIRVYRATNVGNHLHLLIKAGDRKNLANYLRVLAGRIAVAVTGARKGVKPIGKFWDSLCWSRLVRWGRDFFGVRDYLSHQYQLKGRHPSRDSFTEETPANSFREREPPPYLQPASVARRR